MSQDEADAPQTGDGEPAAKGWSLAEGFAAVGPMSFDHAEKNLVFTLVGAVQSTRRSESIIAAFTATALTDLVVLGQRRADRRAAEGKDSTQPMREVITEISAALRVSDRVAHRLLSEAVTLTTAFPQTHSALGDGKISPSHVRVIVDAGSAISDDTARAEYETKVLRVAEIESAGRLRAIAQILAAKVNPESIDTRHRRARHDRNVRVVDCDDGMAELIVYLPATLAQGIHDRLTQMARQRRAQDTATAKAAAEGDGMLPGLDTLLGEVSDPAEATDPAVESATGDSTEVRAQSTTRGDADDGTGDAAPEGDVETDPARSLDELRADLLADLLLTGAPTGHGDGLDEIRGYVQVTVPVLTLAGESEEPAVLAGHGPVDPTTARRLAGAATGWDRVMTHPVTGEVLAVDRYRPSAQLRRFLRVRDQHCRFPGCRVPAWRGDADHTVDAALGGLTCDDNLACLCEPHHLGKHHTGWRVKQLDGGKLEWISPTGRVYIDTPERTLLFIADGDPPPF